MKKYEDSIFGRLFSYASDKKCLFACGLCVAAINGSIFPTFAIFIASMFSALVRLSSSTSTQAEKDQARSDADLTAIIFFVLSIASLIVNLLQQIIFNNIG